MSTPKSSFRSRKIDKHRLMNILLEDDADIEGPIRDTQNIDYGVDKEEANEIHLIESLQTQFQTKKAYVPLPKVTHHNRQRTPITIPDPYIAHAPLDTFVYCANKKDLAFCTQHSIQVDDFEVIVHICEDMMRDRQPHATLFELGDLLHKVVSDHQRADLEENIPLIYDYYKQQYLKKGDTLMPVLIDSEKYINDNDPYKCFRAREVAHHRKTRQTHQSSSKIKQWSKEVQDVLSLIQKVTFKEHLLQELQYIEQLVFHKRTQIKMKRHLMGLPEQEEPIIRRHKVQQLSEGIKQRLSLDRQYVDISLNLFKAPIWQMRTRETQLNRTIDRNKTYDARDALSDEAPEMIDPSLYSNVRWHQFTEADRQLLTGSK